MPSGRIESNVILVFKIAFTYLFWNLLVLGLMSLILDQKPKPTNVLHFIRIYYSELILILGINVGAYFFTLNF